MLYFTLNNAGEVAEVSDRRPPGPNYVDRNDLESFDHAQRVADQAAAATGRPYWPIDQGRGCSPRFDVIEAPVVGDAVSYAFNGDYYPDCHIARVSPSGRVITTTTGRRYTRTRAHSACWRRDGLWSLVPGHIHRLNPEF